MHSFSRADAYKNKQSKSLSRKEWERRHKQSEGCLSKAQKVLQQMYIEYKQHALETQARIQAKTLQIPGDYISGLIEGDGCLSFDVGISKDASRLSFRARLSLTTELGAS